MDFEQKYKMIYEKMMSSGLEWVCQEVDAEIESGNIEPKKTREKANQSSEKYSDKEKYILLLEAYKRGVLEPNILLDEIQNKYMNIDSIDRISFFSEYKDGSTVEISADSSYLNSKIKSQIESIDKELANVRG